MASLVAARRGFVVVEIELVVVGNECMHGQPQAARRLGEDRPDRRPVALLEGVEALRVEQEGPQGRVAVGPPPCQRPDLFVGAPLEHLCCQRRPLRRLIPEQFPLDRP